MIGKTGMGFLKKSDPDGDNDKETTSDIRAEAMKRRLKKLQASSFPGGKQ